jgi:hypothetical protein
MASRDRVVEILRAKSRGQRDAISLHYYLKTLSDRWQTFPVPGDVSAAFFPIRAVTLMEVFTRGWISTFVDHGTPYTARAVALIKTLKIDYELVREIQGRTITLGDIVAHSVSLNNFGQFIAAFEVLAGEGFVSRIARVEDRWKTEIGGESAIPIIPDAHAMCAALDRLFEIHHILVHEYPRTPVYRPDEISPMLQAAANFASATNESCTELLYGKLPLTNADMKDTARNELQDVEAQVKDVLAQIMASSDHEAQRLFGEAQQQWLE